MNKLPKQSVRDYLVKKVGEKLSLPPDTVYVILQQQYKDAEKAMKTANTIEITGFCRFKFKFFKAKKELEIFENMYRAYMNKLDKATDIDEIRNLQARIKTCKNYIDFLVEKISQEKPKNDGNTGNSGGMEEPSVSPQST